ncbi:hypothetical protein ACNPM4_16250, partial [Microbacterium sp. AGC62]
MQQRGIGSALVEREECDVRDSREPLERASNLPAGIDPQRSRPDLIDDDRHRRRRGEPADFCVIPEESADPQRIGCGHGDDQVGFAQRRRRRGMASRAGDIVGHLVVCIEGSRHIDDRLFPPLPTRAQSHSETGRPQFRPSARAVYTGEHLDRLAAAGGDRRGES